MPRRPRPSYRLPPGQGENAKKVETVPSKPNLQTKIRFAEPESEEDDSSEENPAEFEEGSSQESIGEFEESSKEDGDESDTNVPRVAVWEEDRQDFLMRDFNNKEEKIVTEKTLQNDLQDLPLGALRHAQRLLTQAVAESDSDSDNSNSPVEIHSDAQNPKGKGKERVEWSTKRRTDITSRRSKHAPAETTAKKPVSRNRIVVDVPKIVSRDPRFLPTAGTFDPMKFQQSYGFLAESRKADLQTLRENVSKARKRLWSSPRDVRSERDMEVEKLERAVKQVESLVNRDRAERVEQEAISQSKKAEFEKRKQGKGEWFLKKAAQRELLLKARYEAIAKEGGQRAVKKAIQKKQKKISHKEKRSRPEEGLVIADQRPKKKMRAVV